MADRENILIDFIEHEWFKIFYEDMIEKLIKKKIWEIVDPRLEEDERVYTRTQVERKVLKVLELLRDNPISELNAQILNNNPTVSTYAQKKIEQKKNKERIEEEKKKQKKKVDGLT